MEAKYLKIDDKANELEFSLEKARHVMEEVIIDYFENTKTNRISENAEANYAALLHEKELFGVSANIVFDYLVESCKALKDLQKQISDTQ